MASKYDEYWQQRIDRVLGLVAEAIDFGSSKVLDVTDIQKHGNREYWGTSMLLSPDTGAITDDTSPDAHGKSFGEDNPEQRDVCETRWRPQGKSRKTR